MRISNKVVVVTGGGQGIGRAMCARFAREDPAAVAVLDIDPQAASEVAAEVGGLAIACDVADESSIKDAVAEIENRYGRIDLFCANAGIAVGGGIDAPNDVWQRIMDVNFMAHVYSARAVIPGMLARGEGYLLQTASAAGLLSTIGSPSYAVSKHAAVAFAEWLDIAYHDSGILVSCLCPLGVFTDMLSGDDPAVRSLRATALTADEVAEAAVAGIEQERFLILPHPEVATYMQHKAADYDRWLGGMRKMQRQLGSRPSD